MAKTLGYMITWTTYGSWLQGDKRGFVKKGTTCPANKSLADSNKASLTKKPVRLSKGHRQTVEDAILREAASLNQRIHALSVSSNHVHILAAYITLPIGQVVSRYKSAAQMALRKAGVAGRVWTRGFDKRYCFDQQGLRTRIDYVNSHNRKPPNN